MQYRRFGKTQLQMSVASLGTMRCLASQAVMEQTVQTAIAAGINHLETAQGYGSSERFLGQALQQGNWPRSDLILTTKLTPTPDAAAMERALDQSLERLQTDYLDCLAIHGINTVTHLDWIRSATGCMQAVQRAIADGRVRHVGFSTHGSLEVILGAIGTEQFSFVNLHYGLFFQRNRAAIAQAQAQDMGVFIISPGDKGGMLYTPPETLKQLCQPWSPLAANYGFLLTDPRITTLSLGPANPQELQAALEQLDIATGEQDGALGHPPTIAPTLATTIAQRLESHQQQALGDDRCSQCYKCLPCPEEINIPEVLRLRNLAVAYDMQQFGEYRYGMFENAGHWFPGKKASRCTDCGDCLPRCPEQLEIPKLLRETHDRLAGKPRRRLWGD
ncbi:aldo/keto reductase [Alkalinema sp. FACHB-956]|uniref:aldo/keto reductase n=1 Tax=Alkalinema sp. FACHB-956 TaxID=2692768 RepID=UPI001689E390|nr:aldo/keto reductase [Alkalinema sp. FACHB-956]MBD2328305.1 aldo/keto reductase [Alkalinema sp. FACHB-956]